MNQRRPVSKALLMAITSYQRAISSRTGRNCRYEPTCSSYAREAIEIHGGSRGSWLAIRRVARCHPLATKGYQFDPVPGAD